MSQDDEARGGHWRSARGRGLHPGGEGGGACADVFLEPGPHRLLGPGDIWTRHRDRGSFLEAAKIVAARFQCLPEDAYGSHSNFCICQDFFCLCMCKLCYQSLLLVVIDLPESLAAQVPKKIIEKMSVM
jgi:hypothetical protein